MATEPISQLPPAPDGTGSGTSKGTDLFPATDTTDTSSSSSGTTKKYTLSEIYNFMLSAAGITTYSAVQVGTISALTATYSNGSSGVGATLTNAGSQAVIAIDGITLSLTARVLVKNQVAELQNGIYVVTSVGSASSNWVLTRALDYNEPDEIVQYGVMLINQGAVNKGLLYQETAAGPFTIGVTSITFAPFTSQSLSFPVSLAQGGTSASLTANNGGIFFSNASSGEILAGTDTAGRMLQSGANSDPSWSTPTYPSASGTAGKILRSDGTNNTYSTSTFADTYTINSILYAASANTVSGLASVNSAALTTDGSGVPALTALSAGQILIGTTSSRPVASAINSGTNITVANGSGSITVNLSGVVSPVLGGTGVSNLVGATITLGGALTLSGAFTSTFTMTGTTAVTFPTSGTLATTTGSVATLTGNTGTATASAGNINVVGGATGLTFTGASATLTLGGTAVVSHGGTGVTSVTTAPTATAFAGWDANSNLSANNVLESFTSIATASGTTTLTVASTGIIEFTGTLTQTLVLPVASTLAAGTTYKIINNSSGAITVNSSGANLILTMAANTTAFFTLVLASGTTAASWNPSYIFDNGAGVLSIAGTANQVIASASTGAVTLSLPQSIATSSSPTFNGLTLTTLTFSPTTSGIVGTTTNNGATTGIVGEYIESVIASGSPVTLTNNTAANVTSISLTAGDWDVYGNVSSVAASVGASFFLGQINTSSASTGDQSLYSAWSTSGLALSLTGFSVPFRRISIASTTTVYLVAFATFAGTMGVCGGLFARRAR